MFNLNEGDKERKANETDSQMKSMVHTFMDKEVHED